MPTSLSDIKDWLNDFYLNFGSKHRGCCVTAQVVKTREANMSFVIFI